MFNELHEAVANVETETEETEETGETGETGETAASVAACGCRLKPKQLLLSAADKGVRERVREKWSRPAGSRVSRRI